MKKTLIFVLFFIPMLVFSQVTKMADGIKLQTNSTVVEIKVYEADIIRVIKYPFGKNPHKESLSVVMQPKNTKFRFFDSDSLCSLTTPDVSVTVNKHTGMLRFSNTKSGLLLSEKASGSMTPFNDAGLNTYSVCQSFLLDPLEDIFGLGQQQSGKLSQRNVKLNMIQGNTDDYIPFFVSNKNYGLFWDNYSPTLFEDRVDGTTFKSDVGDCIDYYFIQGKTMDGVLAGMRQLTGDVPMFPLWTYGYWQSKERYKSQNELVGVVKKYRELGVPLDGIIQDWQYWGNNYLWNAMEFLNTEFPGPKKMVDDIHNMNAHLIVSIWSSFGPQTKQFHEMQPKGMLLNFGTWPQSGAEAWPPNRDYPSGVQPYDPYNPEARDIYWRYLNKGLFSLGIDGWWMDSTEPDHLDFKPSDFDLKTYLGSFRKVRNAFPLMAVGGVSEHQRAVCSDKRVFILTRSAFAGQQRFGSNTWSGDVNSSWQSLRNQIPAGLNFTLSGIPYWNSDIGGFFAGAYNQKWNDLSGTDNPLFQELYVRWLQFGAFTPMMRSHGTDIPREIYNFGKKGEPIFDAIEKNIRLRYSLLPYIYSTAWRVTNQRYSFMRALPMDFNDARATKINSEYMFGASILVSPIVQAQYTPETVVRSDAQTGWNKGGDELTKQAGTKIDFSLPMSTKVYLPGACSWYDFYSNKQYEGGQDVTIQTSIDKIPLFLKSGSILVLGPDVQFATQKKWDNLEVRIYPGADGEFTLYEDENDNYNYEKGQYSSITFKWHDAAKEIEIEKRLGRFEGMMNERNFRVLLVGKDYPEKTIRYSGAKMRIKF